MRIKTSVALPVVVILIAIATPVLAQMPGMELPKKAEAAPTVTQSLQPAATNATDRAAEWAEEDVDLREVGGA